MKQLTLFIFVTLFPILSGSYSDYLTELRTQKFQSETAISDSTTTYPWYLERSTTIIKHEVKFKNNEVQLYGVLHSPEGAVAGPALVAMHGSGTPEHDSWLFKHLTENLPDLGISVFVYDRRGTGKSGGDAALSTYQELAKDALAAADAIAKYTEVDRNKVGVWGQSQGGWLAMEAGSLGDVAFVINWAGPLVRPAMQNYFVIRNAILLGGHEKEIADKAVEIRRAIDEYVQGNQSYSETYNLLKNAENQEWFERSLLNTADDLPKSVEGSGWIHNMHYNPISALKMLQNKETPTWIVYGGADPVIPVEKSLQILNEQFEDNSDWLKVSVIPDADHILMFPENPDFMESQEIDTDDLGPESWQYIFLMGAWLERVLSILKP